MITIKSVRPKNGNNVTGGDWIQLYPPARCRTLKQVEHYRRKCKKVYGKKYIDFIYISK